MAWAAAGVASAGLTLAAVKWVSGNRKEKKAKKERENLKAPFYDIQDEYYKNVNTANSMAQGGLPSATKDYYTDKSQQGLSAGITAINANSGNPNDMSKIFQSYNDGIGKISAVDAETHLNNIKYYMEVNKDLAGQKTIQWAINKQQPYLNTLKELSAAQKAGEATKNEAYGDALSSLSSFGTSMAGSGGFKKTKTTSGLGGGGFTGFNSSATTGYDSNRSWSGSGSGSGSGMGPGDRESNIQQVADPFSNNESDFAKYQQWLQFQQQNGERKGGW